jgi:hypothetical protein
MGAYSIKGVEESIKFVDGRNLVRFVDLVVRLVKCHALGINQGITGGVSNEQKDGERQAYAMSMSISASPPFKGLYGGTE